MKTLAKSWNYCLEKFGYPNIEFPKIDSTAQTAYINMETKEVKVSENFIKNLDLDEETALRGVLAHEINHHVTCPYDLTNHFLLLNEASKVTSNEKKVANYFFDVIINLDLINRDIKEIAKVYKGLDTDSYLDNTLKNFYCYKTQEDFGYSNKKINNVMLEGLFKIDFSNLNLDHQKESIKAFAKLLEDNLDNATPLNSEVVITAENLKNLNSKKLIENLDPYEYSQVFSKGKALEYYNHLSNKESLKIKQTKTLRKESKYKSWQGKNYTNVNVFKSFGKFFPGISKEKEIKNAARTSLPNSIIAIDSSASMKNPFEEKSEAVIGSFCIADHYLKNSKQVASLNFSEKLLVQDFTEDEVKIKNNLLTYQGELTKFELNDIEPLLSKNNDFYIITDLGLENIDYLINNLSKRNFRTSIINVDNSSLYIKKNNLTIYSVSEENLSKTVIEGLNGI